MESPTTINWSSPFPILGAFVSIFYITFFQNLIEDSVKKTEVPDQTPHYAVSDLALHYCQSPIKKDARLIWVNFKFCFT